MFIFIKVKAVGAKEPEEMIVNTDAITHIIKESYSSYHDDYEIILSNGHCLYATKEEAEKIFDAIGISL